MKKEKEPEDVSIFDRAPEIRIEQSGKHSFLVYISHGAMRYGLDGYGWFCFTEDGALRKGIKELNRYLKKQSYKRAWTV